MTFPIFPPEMTAGEIRYLLDLRHQAMKDMDQAIERVRRLRVAVITELERERQLTDPEISALLEGSAQLYRIMRAMKEANSHNAASCINLAAYLPR